MLSISVSNQPPSVVEAPCFRDRLAFAVSSVEFSSTTPAGDTTGH
jgi:hypothetical protein